MQREVRPRSGTRRYDFTDDSTPAAKPGGRCRAAARVQWAATHTETFAASPRQGHGNLTGFAAARP